MNIIVIILLIIICLELLLLLYYLFNAKIKGEKKLFSIINIILIIIVIIFYFTDISLFDGILDQNSRILLLLSLVSFIIIKLINDLYEFDMKFNHIIKYLVEYEKIIDENGKKNHEYNNQLMILRGYINNKNKLIEYLDMIIDDHNIEQNYRIRQLSKFPNGGLKSMLYYKIREIKEKNIKYYLTVSEDSTELLEKINLKLYNDITKVFGVLIDNAIDAALNSKEKEISLDFSIENHYIVITISNTYNKNIDINKIGKKGYSSKGKGHGFGLRLVKEIVKRNKSLELLTDNNDKYIIQTLLIDIKN